METKYSPVSLRIAKEPLAHRCFNHCRTHCVYSNAAARVFQRRGLGQPDHAMLARWAEFTIQIAYVL